MKNLIGWLKVLILSLPMSLAVTAFTAIVLLATVIGLSFVTDLSLSGKNSLIAVVFVGLFIALAPSFATIYVWQTRQRKGDPNRFRREHLHTIIVGTAASTSLATELKSILKELGYIEIESESLQDGFVIYGVHPDVHLSSGDGIPLGEWYRKRLIKIVAEPSGNSVRLKISMKPVRRVEFLDFSLSNYYYLDQLLRRVAEISK